MEASFDKIAVFGMGLLGGSLCRRIKKNTPSMKIVACDRSQENVRQALEDGVVDEITAPDRVDLTGADLVVVAVPVVASISLILDILSREDLGGNAIVMDVGSVKESILKEVKGHPRSAQFIGCHPMAGSEKSGYGASTDSLYDGARVIITPHKNNTEKDIAAIESLWNGMGATVRMMSSEDHDRLVGNDKPCPPSYGNPSGFNGEGLHGCG